MENALLLKAAAAGALLWAFGKKKSAAEAVDKVITAMPPEIQDDADWYANAFQTWLLYGYLAPGQSGITMNWMLYQAIVVQKEKPEDIAMGWVQWSSGYLPFSNHPMPNLTTVDRYNIAVALIKNTTFTDDHSQDDPWDGGTSQYQISILNDKGNAKIDFGRYVVNLIASKNPDMIYTRTADGFKTGGEHHYLNTGCDSVTNQMFGHGIERGSYTAMRDFIIWASYGGCANNYPSWRNLLTPDQLDGIIRNVIEEFGLTDTLGPNGPNSTYLTSIANRFKDALPFILKALSLIPGLGWVQFLSLAIPNSEIAMDETIQAVMNLNDDDFVD